MQVAVPLVARLQDLVGELDEYYRKHVPEQAGVSLLDPVNGRVPITPVPDPRNLLSGPWAVYSPRPATPRCAPTTSSLYDIDKANAVTDPNPNAYCGGNPACYVNSGQINYKGLEATVNAELTRLFTVDAGWQWWLRAIQNSPDPKFNGLAPENTPKAIGNLRLGFRVPGVKGLILNAGASGVTRRYVNFQQQGTIPGYVLYSAGASWVTSHPMINARRLTFLLNVDNLANLRYWNSLQTGTYGIGMDRTVRMTIKMDM